jgi:phasin family protein
MEIMNMSNETMNLYKELSEQAVASVKSLSELNLRTFETLASKQVEIMQHCMDAGVKQTEVLKSAKDVNGLMAAQTELAASCAEQFTNNILETADILKTAQDELSGLVEASVADVKENVNKVTELSKKSVDEVVQASKPARTTKKAA